tara:strand:+ start:9444 stop:10091 length:648 start_codon:yes stop_codon:yes gene_type:complete
MPLPQRRSEEKRDKFVSRCMSDKKSKKEFPDSSQRLAMCLSNASEGSLLDDFNIAYEYEAFGYTEELNEHTYVNPDAKDYIDLEETEYTEAKIYKYKDPKTGEVYFYNRVGPHKKNDRYLIKANEYQGRKVTLNKPFRTPDGPKKFSVYVKNEKDNVVKVNFGDPNMDIKRDDPARRKSFRARHQCDTNPGPKWKARYWSCKFWESNKSVKDLLK